MQSVVELSDAGVRFSVPRRSGNARGKAPRLFSGKNREFWGARHITMQVMPGEVVGIIGPNGAGKTTTLRLIAGIYRPDEGDVVVRGRVGPVLSLSGGLEQTMSGWENIALSGVLLGLSRKECNEIAPRIAEFAGIEDFMDAPLRVYSSGMRSRLGFAIALLTEPDILLLDEVMETGDQEFREKCRTKIAEHIGVGRAVVAATHNLNASSLEMFQRMIRLEKGEVVDEGEPGEVSERYTESTGVKKIKGRTGPLSGDKGLKQDREAKRAERAAKRAARAANPNKRKRRRDRTEPDTKSDRAAGQETERQPATNPETERQAATNPETGRQPAAETATTE